MTPLAEIVKAWGLHVAHARNGEERSQPLAIRHDGVLLVICTDQGMADWINDPDFQEHIQNAHPADVRGAYGAYGNEALMLLTFAARDQWMR